MLTTIYRYRLPIGEMAPDLVNAFSVIDTSAWEVVEIEPSGIDFKCVLIDPAAPAIRWFFKTNSVDSNMRYGEDYAELVASHLAPLLGVHSAQVFLATHSGRDGVISKDVSRRGLELVHGAAWLPARGISEFVPGDRRHRQGHSLINIKTALQGVSAPLEASYPSGMSAFDAFAGMCLFDAWISNQDRHEENWAVLNPVISHPDLQIQLSPIYDNGSSLAFNLQEERMQAMLDNVTAPTVRTWSEKATAKCLERVAPRYEKTRLVDAARDALDLCTTAGRDHWLKRINNVDIDRARALPHEVPKMSDVRSRFISELITTNMERIRNVCAVTA